MGILKTTWTVAWFGTLGYIWLGTAEKAGNETAQATKSIVDGVATQALDILENVGVYIGDFAPLSSLWLTDLIERLWTTTSIGELGLASAMWLWAWYIWGKVTEGFWKMTWHDSETDNIVGKAGLWIAGAATVIWAGVVAGTVAAGATTYILWKKLSQFILSEKYAHYLWLAFAVWGASVAWWANEWTVIWSMLLAGAGAGAWDSGKSSREKQTEKRKDQWFMKTYLWIWKTKSN